MARAKAKMVLCCRVSHHALSIFVEAKAKRYTLLLAKVREVNHCDRYWVSRERKENWEGGRLSFSVADPADVALVT